jgi:CRISPR system Cascade subunit CasD
MSVLLLRLCGPMQSWGTQSRFADRDTGLEPTKSGVIGLLFAALGVPRDSDAITVEGTRITLSGLAAMQFGVRVDREGVLLEDFQTAGGARSAHSDNGHRHGVVKADGRPGKTVLSRRQYLADADFLVGIAGDLQVLSVLQHAVRYPVWPLFLGRKAFVPGKPVWIPDGLLEHPADIEAAFADYPWRLESAGRGRVPALRMILETSIPDGEVRQDVPVSFSLDNRSFTTRRVTTRWLESPVVVGVDR